MIITTRNDLYTYISAALGADADDTLAEAMTDAVESYVGACSFTDYGEDWSDVLEDISEDAWNTMIDECAI